MLNVPTQQGRELGPTDHCCPDYGHAAFGTMSGAIGVRNSSGGPNGRRYEATRWARQAELLDGRAGSDVSQRPVLESEVAEEGALAQVVGSVIHSHDVPSALAVPALLVSLVLVGSPTAFDDHVALGVTDFHESRSAAHAVACQSNLVGSPRV